jgi:hypothetical protein
MYFTLTGNTTKVANRFKEVFEKRGWECDVLKVGIKTDVTQSPSVLDYSKYDLFCFGSGNYKSRAGEHVIDMMRFNPADIHYNPNMGEAGPGLDPSGVSPQYMSGVGPGSDKERPMTPPPDKSGSPRPSGHRRLPVTPEWKKGIVFVTFAGGEFGWIEAIPALEQLSLEMRHMKIECIDKFSCPGRFGPENPNGYFKDLHTRPNEKDLMSAEIFMERVLDSLE